MANDQHDLTEAACRKAYAAGEVVWVQANPNDMSVIFFTNKSDKGFIVNGRGAVKRYKSNFDRELVISKIKDRANVKSLRKNDNEVRVHAKR